MHYLRCIACKLIQQDQEALLFHEFSILLITHGSMNYQTTRGVEIQHVDWRHKEGLKISKFQIF